MARIQQNITKEEQELGAILKVICAHSRGLNRDQILQNSGLDIPLRTLQRRLLTLVTAGKVNVAGKARNTIYKSAISESKVEEVTIERKELVFSAASEQALLYLATPVEKRKQISYIPSFLYNYKPNATILLSENEIGYLSQIGKTAQSTYPAATHAKQILNRLLIDLSWNSSRLEGNTYSLLDTQRLIESGAIAPDKSNVDAQMILNHKDAIEFIIENADDGIGFNRYTILNLHALLSQNLLSTSMAEGKLRSIPVEIGKSTYRPLHIPHQIDEMFNVILAKADEIKDPFEQSFFIMVHLPYLQAFEDVNKRVSRVAANIPLIKNNYSPLSFVEVPRDHYISALLAIYELTDVNIMKDLFIWAYERSALRYAQIKQTVGEPDAFRLKYRQEIREAVATIIKELLNGEHISRKIRGAAEKVSEEDRERFIESVETDILNLTEGNIAKYRVTRSEFFKWKEVNT